MVSRPPLSIEVVWVLPSDATSVRAVGSGSPTNEPSPLAVLIHTPAVDSEAVPRTVTLLLPTPSSGVSGARVATGCKVMFPAGMLMAPATSICGARSSSDEPGAPSMRTPSGTPMRPLALISTESKAVCA